MSRLKDEAEILRRVPLFAGIDLSKLKLLAFTSELVRFAAGDTFFRQGDVGDSAYVILIGSAAILAETPGGGEIEIARIGETDFVGEIAILCDVPRTATVRAVTDVKALKISKDSFSELIMTFPSIGITMMRELARRLSRTTAELVLSQSTKEPQ